MKITFNPRVLDRIKYENQIKNDSELAKELNVERSTIARWRNKEGSPNFAALAQMALRYKIPFAEMAVEENTQAA